MQFSEKGISTLVDQDQVAEGVGRFETDHSVRVIESLDEGGLQLWEELF